MHATTSLLRRPVPVLTLAVALVIGPSAAAQDDSAEALAKKLANPISSLISVPIQLNYDQDFGLNDRGDRLLLNVQPVIPIALNEDWNLISRTIVPLVDQQDLFPGAGGQTGLGDVVQSLFFSPARPTRGGLVWGVGPVLLLPTGSDDLLTADKWGIGPTFVALKQAGPLTYGALTNHIESVAGEDARRDVSATFLQPFLSKTTPTAWTYAVNAEMTYDWKGEQWTIPLNVNVTRLRSWGGQRVQLGGGLRYWLESSDAGPEGLGLRAQLTFLFPK